MNKCDIIIKYLKILQGIKFNKTSSPPNPYIDEPSYYINTNAPLPKLNELKKEGINCSGLVNLARRKIGLEIAGNIKGRRKYNFIGNTQAWFKYLKDNNRLEKIDINKKYPKGTLLLKNYTPKTNGHISIVYDNSMNIIHTQNHNPDKKTHKVLIQSFESDYKYKKYTHICYPKNWIYKN